MDRQSKADSPSITGRRSKKQLLSPNIAYARGLPRTSFTPPWVVPIMIIKKVVISHMAGDCGITSMCARAEAGAGKLLGQRGHHKNHGDVAASRSSWYAPCIMRGRPNVYRGVKGVQILRSVTGRRRACVCYCSLYPAGCPALCTDMAEEAQLSHPALLAPLLPQLLHLKCNHMQLWDIALGGDHNDGMPDLIRLYRLLNRHLPS